MSQRKAYLVDRRVQHECCATCGRGITRSARRIQIAVHDVCLTCARAIARVFEIVPEVR